MKLNPDTNGVNRPGAKIAGPRGNAHPKATEVSKAYQIAGVAVATSGSRYHHLVGNLDLDSEESIKKILLADPEKFPQQDGVLTLKKIAAEVAAEREMLLLAGRQAELIHFTLHAPAESDRAIRENDQSSHSPVMDVHVDQHLLSLALGLVTHHWHEIECVAAWLTRQHRKVVPVADIELQLSRIRPEDQGLFP